MKSLEIAKETLNTPLNAYQLGREIVLWLKQEGIEKDMALLFRQGVIDEIGTTFNGSHDTIPKEEIEQLKGKENVESNNKEG